MRPLHPPRPAILPQNKYFYISMYIYTYICIYIYTYWCELPHMHLDRRFYHKFIYIYIHIHVYIYLWMRISLYPPRPAILAPQTIEVKRRITIVIVWIFPPFNMMYIEMIVMGSASQKIMITSPLFFYFFIFLGLCDFMQKKIMIKSPF
jgi:hypothetical protein